LEIDAAAFDIVTYVIAVLLGCQPSCCPPSRLDAAACSARWFRWRSAGDVIRNVCFPQRTFPVKNPRATRHPSTIVNRTVTPRRPRNADLEGLTYRGPYTRGALRTSTQAHATSTWWGAASLAQGETQADIARSYAVDPATISRLVAASPFEHGAAVAQW